MSLLLTYPYKVFLGEKEFKINDPMCTKGLVGRPNVVFRCVGLRFAELNIEVLCEVRMRPVISDRVVGRLI